MLFGAWMYQINPARGFYVQNGKKVPTTYEYTIRELHDNKVGPWFFHYGAKRIRVGDVMVIKLGGSQPRGIAFVGQVAETKIVGRKHQLWFTPNKRANAVLCEFPVPAEWVRANLPHLRGNLVDVSPKWSSLSAQLRRRGVTVKDRIIGPPVIETLRQPPLADHQIVGPIEDRLGEEGRRVLTEHVSYERRRRNREVVLAQASRPYRCEACGLSFAGCYGKEFGDYIEVHHKKPVSHGLRVPSPRDFALLCANCHAVVHWKADGRPRGVRELKRLVRLARERLATSARPSDNVLGPAHRRLW